MNVSWSDDEEFQLTEIWRSIARDNPQAAGQLSRMIDDAVESIALFHHMGKQGRSPGTREFIVHQNYCIVYKIHQEMVFVVSVMHASRRWPLVES